MLVFKTSDQELLILINGVTKRPEELSQDDLKQLHKNGDQRIVELADPETDDKPKAEKPTGAKPKVIASPEA